MITINFDKYFYDFFFSMPIKLLGLLGENCLIVDLVADCWVFSGMKIFSVDIRNCGVVDWFWEGIEVLLT